MSSQAVSPNTASGSPSKGNTTSSMLGPFIYDTSPLADRLIQRAMAAATATKDNPSNDIDVKVFEGCGETTVEL
ncbi:hypothetical protein NW755_006083 [Fusarium falciforme]|uniref:Uncharacterized protein n=1 Tax=Fusarium falciforme TaxID=195108 RepID=A0A9W8R8D5_9HYPO|nr:hypothetical protein NW755_006083 [Fusarium falciforme]